MAQSLVDTERMLHRMIGARDRNSDIVVDVFSAWSGLRQRAGESLVN